LDVKINAPELIPEKTNIYKNKSITIASVTDPYQPEEGRYKLMSKILAKLIPLQPKLCVMTKSCLIVRDIELLKQFKECIVGISLSLLDDKIRKEVEPFSSSVKLRIGSVKALKESTIRTSIFIAPMFPELTDWKEIIRKTKSFVDEFWFENLNVRGVNWMNIKRWLKDKRPDLLKKYEGIYFTKNNYWKNIEQEIRLFCKKDKLDFKIYFHH